MFCFSDSPSFNTLTLNCFFTLFRKIFKWPDCMYSKKLEAFLGCLILKIIASCKNTCLRNTFPDIKKFSDLPTMISEGGGGSRRTAAKIFHWPCYKSILKYSMYLTSTNLNKKDNNSKKLQKAIMQYKLKPSISNVIYLFHLYY